MSTQTNRTLTAALALALAVGLTACGTTDDAGPGVGVESPSATQAATDGTDDATGTDDTDDDSVSGTTGSADAGSGGDRNAVALDAVATAAAEAGGTAYEIDDQDDDGTWEVDVAVGDRSVEVTVSADGRTVVETDEDELDEDDRAGLDAATITLQDAIETAVAEVGGTVDDAELEEEEGTHYWQVSVDGPEEGDDDVDVLVDVSTGEVIRVEA